MKETMTESRKKGNVRPKRWTEKEEHSVGGNQVAPVVHSVVTCCLHLEASSLLHARSALLSSVPSYLLSNTSGLLHLVLMGSYSCPSKYNRSSVVTKEVFMDFPLPQPAKGNHIWPAPISPCSPTLRKRKGFLAGKMTWLKIMQSEGWKKGEGKKKTYAASE